jgi:plastocyanin
VSPRTVRSALCLAAVVALAACGKEGAKPAGSEPAKPAGGGDAVTPTGKVITIQMIADEKGSRYEPSEIEAHRGDVLRFTLGVGVHNVHFLPDSNPGVANLPDPSDMLQLPGQTFDLTVALPAGKTYYFQCDPHVPLGMKGHLKVD